MPFYKIPEVPTYNNPLLQNTIQAHLDDLTKPKGSLGKLESFAMQYCMCRNSATARIKNPQLFTVAADHGITAQNITPFPKEVTQQMTLNMLQGGAAVSVMCKNANIRYSVVDAGVDADFPDHPLLIKRKIAYGTEDFSTTSAMSYEQCGDALRAGATLATQSEADLIGIGEMGIGNSASASALYALLLDLNADTTTGAGTGSVGDLLVHKTVTIQKALDLHRKEWDFSPFDALRRCGGLEIAMISGMILGAASGRIPVVVDGFISGVAALCAIRLKPEVRDYLFFSHVSAEKFHREFYNREGIEPVFDLEMRLGEGTGAVIAMQIIFQALNCYHEMATFSSALVSKEI